MDYLGFKEFDEFQNEAPRTNHEKALNIIESSYGKKRVSFGFQSHFTGHKMFICYELTLTCKVVYISL
jgi:hypothetical protein